MHQALVDLNVASVRTRIAQGDCPTEPALSTETLEETIASLADALARRSIQEQPEADDVRPRVAEVVSEIALDGNGRWMTCSGCHETNEGAETGHYPFSKSFDCILGAGCHECGGIGAVWDTTDYEDMARSILSQDASAPPPIAGAGWKLVPIEPTNIMFESGIVANGYAIGQHRPIREIVGAVYNAMLYNSPVPTVPDNTDARGAEVKVLTVAEPTLAETLASRHKALMLESEREASAAAQVGDRERQSIASTESERHRAVYHAMCLIVADQSCAAIIPGTDASGVIERYDQIIAKCAQAVGAGIAPQASMEFKELLPGEIAGVVGKLREALTRLERCTRTIIGGLAPGQSINNDAGHTNTLESAMNEAADLLDKLRALDPVKAQKP